MSITANFNDVLNPSSFSSTEEIIPETNCEDEQDIDRSIAKSNKQNNKPKRTLDTIMAIEMYNKLFK